MVAGLGNPGREYEGTPHNIGFAVVDGLAQRLGSKFRRSFRFGSKVGQAGVGEEPVLLVKPLTYMNNSGSAVAGIIRYRRMTPGDLVVVLDDADLEPGKLRIRTGGSSGGHRGLDSIIRHVGTAAFTRVRLGIGRRPGGASLADHVLSPMPGEAREQMARVIEGAVDAVLCILEAGADTAMNRFNGREY